MSVRWRTNAILPRPGAASFKRLLDGALFPDARARRAPLGARARPWAGKLPVGSHPTEGRARRGLPVARPWGVGRGEQIPLREHRCAAPRVLTVPKRIDERMFVGRQRAAQRPALKLRRLGWFVTNGILPQRPGAASFKRVLDGELFQGARARRARSEGRARHAWKASFAHPTNEMCLRGAHRPVAHPEGGARRSEAGSRASELGAPGAPPNPKK